MNREERIAELKKHAIFLSLMFLRDGAGREMPYPPSHTLATAITETIAELERLEKANVGLRDFLGVMVKEMELFLEGSLPNRSIESASGSILRWKTFIEEACRITAEGGDKPNG